MKTKNQEKAHSTKDVIIATDNDVPSESFYMSHENESTK